MHGVEVARGLRHVRIGDGRDDVDVELGGVGQIEARQPAHHRDAAPDGVRSGGGREQRQERPLVQDPDAGAARRSVELIATKGRPDRREPVVVGVVGADLLGGGAVDRVDVRPICTEQLLQRARAVLHHLVDEADRLGRHGVVVSAELRVDVAVLVELGDRRRSPATRAPRAPAARVRRPWSRGAAGAARGRPRWPSTRCRRAVPGRADSPSSGTTGGWRSRSVSIWSCRAGSRRCCRPARSGRRSSAPARSPGSRSRARRRRSRPRRRRRGRDRAADRRRRR